MKKLTVVLILALIAAGCAVQQGGAKKRGAYPDSYSEQYSPASGEQPAAPAGK